MNARYLSRRPITSAFPILRRSDSKSQCEEGNSSESTCGRKTLVSHCRVGMRTSGAQQCLISILLSFVVERRVPVLRHGRVWPVGMPWLWVWLTRGRACMPLHDRNTNTGMRDGLYCWGSATWVGQSAGGCSNPASSFDRFDRGIPCTAEELIPMAASSRSESRSFPIVATL